MPRKTLLFALIALAQLAIPAWMIVDHERILREGEVLHFRTAPIDPRDPFRGEYVRLDFAAEQGSWPVARADDIGTGAHHAFATLATDSGGFALITSLMPDRPADGPYIEVEYMSWDNDLVTRVALPFDRFYLEEGDGRRTEELLAPQWTDDAFVQPLPAYAVVRILKGKAVIQDLVVGDRPIHQWLEAAATGMQRPTSAPGAP